MTPAQRKEGIQVCLLWHRHRCQSRRWQRRQPRHRCQSRHLRQSWHHLLQRPRRKITKKFLKKTVDFAKRRNLLIKTRNWTSKRVAESPDRFLFSLQTF